VWDTVGKLGMPARVLAFVEERDLFFDPILGSNVRVARHAVSIDERRGDFIPTLWDPKETADMKQVWFAGVHSDVGGGYKPTREGKLLSDIPLAWMAREAEGFDLQFESHLYVKSRLDHRTAAHKSLRGFWKVFGRNERTLPFDAVVHASVKKRYEAGDYRSKPLERWLDSGGGAWGDIEA